MADRRIPLSASREYPSVCGTYAGWYPKQVEVPEDPSSRKSPSAKRTVGPTDQRESRSEKKRGTYGKGPAIGEAHCEKGPIERFSVGSRNEGVMGAL